MDNSDGLEHGGILSMMIAAALIIVGFVMLLVLVLGSAIIGGAISAENKAQAQAAATTPPAPDAVVIEQTDEPLIAVPLISAESTPAPTPAPSAQPSVGRIAVIDPDQQLVTVDPDGTALSQLTDKNDRRNYAFPAWSVTGRNIATIQTSRRGNNGIWVFDDSAETPPLSVYESAPAAPIYLYWSPNSELISFIEPGPDDLNFNVISADGSSPRTLGSGTPFYWDWADDSSEIVIHSGATTTSDAAIGVINTATGAYQALDTDGSGFFQSPDFSPNDNKLAYAQGQTRSDREIIITGNQPSDTISIDHNGFAAMTWSPLGNQLAFISNEFRNQRASTYGPLKLVSADGALSVIESGTVFAFFWSPNGRRIAYLSPPTINDSALEASIIPAPALESSKKDRLANPVAQTQENVRFALWVVDTATGEREQLGLFTPSAPFIQQFLPFFDQYAHSHSLWSPQSEAIIFPVADEGVDVIYRFFADGRLPTKVTEGSIGFWSHQ